MSQLDINQSCQGFFNVVKAGSTVKNLHLKNVNIKTSKGMMIGAAVGYIPKDDNTKTTTIENVTVEGKIEMVGYANVGVILGRAEAGSGKVVIKNCKVLGSKGSYVKTLCDTNTNFCGGIAGAIYGNADNLIKDCTVSGINFEGHCAAIGGVVGFIERGRLEGCSVKNCNLSNKTNPEVDIMSMVAVGAMAGTINSDNTEAVRKLNKKTVVISGCSTENVKIKINNWIEATKTLASSTNAYYQSVYGLGVSAEEMESLGPTWDCWSVVGTNRWLDNLDPEKDSEFTYLTVDNLSSLKTNIIVENL